MLQCISLGLTLANMSYSKLNNNNATGISSHIEVKISMKILKKKALYLRMLKVLIYFLCEKAPWGNLYLYFRSYTDDIIKTRGNIFF